MHFGGMPAFVDLMVRCEEHLTVATVTLGCGAGGCPCLEQWVLMEDAHLSHHLVPFEHREVFSKTNSALSLTRIFVLLLCSVSIVL